MSAPEGASPRSGAAVWGIHGGAAAPGSGVEGPDSVEARLAAGPGAVAKPLTEPLVGRSVPPDAELVDVWNGASDRARVGAKCFLEPACLPGQQTS